MIQFLQFAGVRGGNFGDNFKLLIRKEVQLVQSILHGIQIDSNSVLAYLMEPRSGVQSGNPQSIYFPSALDLPLSVPSQRIEGAPDKRHN